MPRAEAFAVTNGRFIAIGSTADIKNLIGKDTKTFDAQQMTIVPGFTDCHNHAGGKTLLYEVLVGNPFEVEFVTIAQHHREAAREGAADAAGHVGRGLFLRRHEAEGQARAQRARPRRGVARPSGRRAPSRRPHVVLQQQGASRWPASRRTRRTRRAARSTATPTASSTAASPTARGRRSTASARARRSRPEQTAQRGRDGLAYISKQFVRYGLTSVHHEGGDLPAMQDVRARGDLLHRVSYEASGRVLDSMIAGGIMTGFGDEWIRFGATSEHTVDGSFSERTMALSTPYPGDKPRYKGNVTDDAGRPERLGRARASRRHPGELPRQRRRRDRHVSSPRSSARRSCSRAPTRARRSRTAR